jgi:ArsR family transcriptional regulator, arsenate/arsenite/antimonite-responsive transcriptional repressor
MDPAGPAVRGLAGRDGRGGGQGPRPTKVREADTALNLTFKAISDPTRREILKLLSRKDMTAGDIADRFDISKPSISHHLNVLKQAGLVTDERRGQEIIYSIDTTVFQEAMGWVVGVVERGKKPSGRKS